MSHRHSYTALMASLRIGHSGRMKRDKASWPLIFNAQGDERHLDALAKIEFRARCIHGSKQRRNGDRSPTANELPTGRASVQNLPPM